MATTVAWNTVFDRLVDNEASGFGMLITGTATISTNQITTLDARVAASGDNQVSQKYEGRIVYIPSAAAADQIRSVLNIDTNETTGVTTITVVGPVFTATSTDVDIYILAEDPDVIRNLGNKALQELHFEAEVPLRHFPDDADMQESSTSNWTGTATPAKTTTADSVWSMARAMTVTDGGAGGQYVESDLYPVHSGKQVSVYLIAKGDGRLDVLDASDNVVESISFDTEQWVYGRTQFTPNVDQVKLRLVSVAAGGVVTWQGAWGVRETDTVFRLPSWMGNRLAVKNVTRASFWESVTGDDLYASDSAIYSSLKQGTAWQPLKRTADANVRMVRLMHRYSTFWNDALFVIVDCPYSAPYGIAATLDSFTATTVCPEDLLLAAVKRNIGRTYQQTWPELEVQGTAELTAQQTTTEMANYDPPERSGFSMAFSRRGRR